MGEALGRQPGQAEAANDLTIPTKTMAGDCVHKRGLMHWTKKRRLPQAMHDIQKGCVEKKQFISILNILVSPKLHDVVMVLFKVKPPHFLPPLCLLPPFCPDPS